MGRLTNGYTRRGDPSLTATTATVDYAWTSVAYSDSHADVWTSVAYSDANTERFITNAAAAHTEARSQTIT